MAKRRVIASYSDRIVLTFNAVEGEDEQALMIQELVGFLREKKALGLSREWVAGAVIDRFKRERMGGLVLPASLPGWPTGIATLSPQRVNAAESSAPQEGGAERNTVGDTEPDVVATGSDVIVQNKRISVMG